MPRYRLKKFFLFYLTTIGEEFGCETIAKAARATRRRTIKLLAEAFTLAEVLYPKKLYSCAFTLAEVLIVLGIIGLIADMTIPTLISSTQEKVAVTRLQKTYSTFENAFRLAVAENGTPDNWGLTNTNDEGAIVDGGINMLNKFEPYLKILKRCDGRGDCQNGTYKLLGGAPWDVRFDQAASAMMADGTIFVFVSWRENCNYATTDGQINNICGSLSVDINGFSKPNQAGVDYFVFYITKFGIIPWGTEKDTDGNNFTVKCAYRGNNFENGTACTAWVLYNGNMDYLHCNDLTWEGKKSCK